MKLFFVTLFLLCNLSCNKRDENPYNIPMPKTGKFGNICYPPHMKPPVLIIQNISEANYLKKDCKEFRGTPIIYNTNFKDLSFFKRYKSLDGLDIKVNPNLTSLSGLENLEYINSNIVIYGNPKLKDISALSSVKEINGNVYINSGRSKEKNKRQEFSKEHIASTFYNVKIKKLYITTYINIHKTEIIECRKEIKSLVKKWICLSNQYGKKTNKD